MINHSLQHGMDSRLLQWRGTHDRLAVDKVRHGNRTIAARVVVADDVKFVDALEEAGVWGAYCAIRRALELGGAHGLSAVDLSSVRGGQPSRDAQAEFDLRVRFGKWYQHCQREKVNARPEIVRSLIIDGFGVRRTARYHGIGDHTIMPLVIRALKLWSEF